MAGSISARLYDVSFAGSTITVNGATITDFVDDANPIEFQDVVLTRPEFSCNGRMIRCIKPNPIVMSVTVIPGSASDKGLFNLWKGYYCGISSMCKQFIDCNITIGNNTSSIKSISLKGGTMISGPGGFSANGVGKMKGKTYVFAFQNVQ